MGIVNEGIQNTMFVLSWMYMEEQVLGPGRLIKQIDDEIEKRANNALRKIDLTVAQLYVLHYLMKEPDGSLTMKEVEKKLHVAQSTATGLSMRLEMKGLIVSGGTKEDRRIKVITITEEGRCLTRTARSYLQEIGRDMVSVLTEEEQTVFMTLLKKVRDGF